MKRAAFAIACALLLAGCDTEPQVRAENASVGEVADKIAEAGGGESFVRPGKWQSRFEIEKFDIPGAPPGASDAMRSMADRAQVTESCLTPEQAKRPKEDFFAGEGKNCRYERFAMGNGKIDAVMKCSSEGMAQTMAMQGTYGPDAYQMRMNMAAQAGSGPPGGMTMTMRVDAKRIGECDGTTA
jgi:hypothetical protein